MAQREVEIREAAQRLFERQFGAQEREREFQRRYKAAGLAFDKKKHADATAAAKRKGAQPNAALSKVYGYVVDKNGNPILGGNGKRIPVAKDEETSDTTPSQESALINRAQEAGKKALDALAKRVENTMTEPKWAAYKASPALRGKWQEELNRRLRNARGNAMTDVINAISPHLKALGYTQAQIKSEAEKIVNSRIRK